MNIIFYKALFLFIFLLNSGLGFAGCDIHLERANIVSNEFFELDISDSYNLEKGITLKNKKLIPRVVKLSHKVKAFNEDRKEVDKQINSNNVIFYKIKGDLGSLSSFLVKGNLSRDRYFSFILYSDCDLLK